MPISEQQYLSTSYRPDCDYVDGEVIERNLGERDHGVLQRNLVVYFHSRRREWNVSVFLEQRVQVSKTRYRVPDVCLYVGDGPKDQIFRMPPFICIEILSPEDRVARIQQRIDDYLNFGVAYVWVIDPSSRRPWSYTTEGSREIKDGILATRNPSLTVDLAEIFSELDS